MENNIIKTKSINVDQIKYILLNHKVKPIDNLLIPDITFPSYLSTRRRQSESDSELIINIRLLFNSLSTENVNSRSEQLQNMILENAKSSDMIKDISNEIFSHFMNDEKLIPSYLRLLNSVFNMMHCPVGVSADELKKKNNQPTIGNIFLNKCRETIIGMIDLKNIKKLSEFDMDDIEECDNFNDQREKIFNLITTICHLYEQRNGPYIHLTANQVIPLISTILKYYKFIHNELCNTVNPYETDCSDEDVEKYESLKKMANIYAEQIYHFINLEIKNFYEDKSIVSGTTFADIIDSFKTQVVPNITESYLINKCKNINY